MKTRPDLEAEAIRLIRAVETNIVLDAKEVLVQALDRMQVDGAVWAAEKCGHLYYKNIITTALENRAIYAIENKSGAASVG